MALPTTPAHLSRAGMDGGAGEPDALFIEEYGGLVDMAFHEESKMKKMIEVRTVRGTNKISNYRIGDTALSAITPGVRPDATPTNFGDVSVTVDTVVLARNNVALLDDLQNNYDAKVKLAQMQGELLGEYFDKAVYIQAMKAARSSAPANMDGFKSGTVVPLVGANSWVDPDKIEAGIIKLVEEMAANKVKIGGNQFGTTGFNGVCVHLAPQQYYTLLRSQKLVSKDFSTGNGDFAKGEVLAVAGVRIEQTTALPNAAVTGHLLSNVSNGGAYNVSAAEAKIVALAMAPRAVLAGETIGLESDIWYDKKEKQWFMDTHMAFGVAPDRAEMAAVLDKP